MQTELFETNRVPSLAELEGVIERGLQTFVEVGEALREISERRLYRERGYGTFDEYCRERWGWSRFAGYQYIRAAEVAKNVESTQQSLSVTQAFELSRLEPEQQCKVAAEMDFSESSVRQVQRVVEEVKSGTPVRLAVHFSSESGEWYTPPEIIDRTLRALGGIDLDPCSNSLESPNIPAVMHYTSAHDG